MQKSWTYWTALTALFVIAVWLRLWVCDVDRKIVIGDETTYWNAAQNLLQHRVLTRDVDGAMLRGEKPRIPTSALSPGYPLFIAAIGLAAPESTSAVLVANIILSVGSLIIILLIMQRLSLERHAILAVMAVAAIYPGFLYNIDRMLTEHLFVALLLGSSYAGLVAVQSGKLWQTALATMLLSMAVHLRAQAFPFLIVLGVFLWITRPSALAWRHIYIMLGVFLLMLAPWWVRNIITFGRFIPLTEAGQGAAIWGAVPYFIDMGSSHGALTEVTSRNMSPNEAVYYRWRLFGYLQFMWGDIWDENLGHPKLALRPFLLLQPALVVPALIATPLVAIRSRIEWIMIACVPLVVTLCNAIFHGLPRYAYPAVPYALIVFGMLISRDRGLALDAPAHRVIRYSFITLATLFSLLVAYSIYFFPGRMPMEMSEYRISRYLGIKIGDLNGADVIDKHLIDLQEASVENATKKGPGIFRNEVNLPPIIKFEVPKANANVATKVTLNIQGGFVYDYMVIYWKGARTADFNENNYYKIPTNPLKRSVTVYIDDDVDGLMVVPYVFRWSTFHLESARVQKLKID